MSGKQKIQDHTILSRACKHKENAYGFAYKGLPPSVFKEHLACMGLQKAYDPWIVSA